MCETTFTDATAPEIAKRVARHWNRKHGDELDGIEPFKTEQYGGEHLHGNEYSYRVYEYYITAFDVLDASGHSTGPFAYQYVNNVEAADHCEDCWQPIEDVAGYHELPSDSWRDTYICNQCHRQREIERHTQENQQITEFSE